jgi:cytidine deaminase
MAKKELKIAYEIYSSVEDLSSEDRNLVRQAMKARESAYAPYSSFRVGAAVRLSDGRVFTASNQENSAYPSGMCAERVALYAAHAALNDAYVQDLAVVGGEGDTLSEEPVCACGACLQVLKEFESQQPVNVLYVGQREVLKIQGVRNLLPFAFTK